MSDIFKSASYAAKKVNNSSVIVGPKWDLLAPLWNVSAGVHPTGSRYICDPPVMNTDEDYVVLGRTGTIEAIEKMGFETKMEDYDGRGFLSYRKDHYNIIYTGNKLYFKNYVAATEIAKKFNLLKKEDRITLFDLVIERKIDERWYANHNP